MTMPLALALRCLDTRTADFDVALQGLRAWSSQTDDAIETAVKAIVDDVRRRGDAAVIDCTRRFDALAVDSMGALQLSRSDFAAAHRDLGSTQRQALADAAARIKAYHARQLQATSRTWSYRDADGNLLGQKVTPLDRVGVYVPGGRAAYPSSLLMSVVPARVANVGEVIMMVPTPGGVRNELVLAAAHIAGVDRAFTVGGAQAIAALAYGTASVPRVDKITGPGNAYVASAKKHVFGQVGIDMIAGPSEILVLADGSTPPDWVAMDLFSQAEHDELAQAILLTPDAAYLERVRMAIDRLLPTMPRAAIIRASLEGRGALVLTRSMEEACEIANRLAPEHLEVASSEPHRWEPLLRHAGAIFLGHHSSESLGDYAAGPNHVLPTAGTARFSSPLGVYDFVKRTSVIEISAAGAQVLGAVASTLAHGEGLPAHALAAEMRMGADALALTSGDGTPTRVTSTTVSPGERVLRCDIQGMHAYAVQPSAGMVKLDTMENPYRLPPTLQAALGERLGHVAINRYPAERTEDLRQALARFAGMPEGCALTLGNGSDELISMLTMACDTPGACVMAPLPGFVMYEMSARMLGVRFIGVPLTNDFELDEAAMLAAIEREKPALLYLAYPNNPTANLWQAATIERLIQAMADVQGLVVMDEAYQPFASHDSMAWLQRWPHVLVMRTMSKFGLAGVRIGYLLGRRELIDVVDKLRPPFNVSVLNAEAALFALEHADEFARQAAAIRSERSRLAAALAALPGVNPFPSQANMILARVADSRRVFEGMRERRVLIKNVAPMHALLHGCIRITVGTPDENDQMLSALKASLP